MEDRADSSSFFYVLQDAVHILFVDDDPIMREFAMVHLSTDKAQVTLACDGVEALEGVAALHPDIVLLDLEMPRLDGFEVLAKLRAGPETRELPVIVVTGREDVGAIDRAFEAGATSFLVKPINWRLLSYQIRYVMRAGRGDSGSNAPSPKATALQAGLRKLAHEGAELVRQAVGGSPELRQAALRYAMLLAETVDPPPSSRHPA
ncbi:PleD family two-component system response regulator [Caulobacter sp. S45]|uniref:response regulator n=1 Tax=Caulobacter sp. S45 TaxID=1641861 RepID=UPI0020C5CA2F|nr:response regulator [Caulobacter sp. S45]